MFETLIALIIVVLVVGFLYWAYTKLIGLVPMPPQFRQVLDVLVMILAAAIILFYVVIPVIRLLAHAIPLG